MANEILFVFEGERTEKKIVQSMQRVFMTDNVVVTSVFGAEIYQLYEKIEADKDLDTFALIKERNFKDNEFLLKYSRDDFAEIYLFFDYDGHATKASDDKIAQLLELFNEETDRGKLYISYPMVEALRHVKDKESFKELCVQGKENIGYKALVSLQNDNKFQHVNQYDHAIWFELLDIHLCKANFLVVGDYQLPKTLLLQSTLFLAQLQQHILPKNEVSVLSAFPLFLHDYFGNDAITKRLNAV